MIWKTQSFRVWVLKELKSKGGEFLLWFSHTKIILIIIKASLLQHSSWNKNIMLDAQINEKTSLKTSCLQLIWQKTQVKSKPYVLGQHSTIGQVILPADAKLYWWIHTCDPVRIFHIIDSQWSRSSRQCAIYTSFFSQPWLVLILISLTEDTFDVIEK